MPSTDSGLPEKMDAMPPEQVVGMTRNGWSASIGFAGRHGPDYAGVVGCVLLGFIGFLVLYCAVWYL